MRIFAGLLAVIGVVVLAINIGNRIPPDTVAMGVGVVLGALTALPMSLILGAVFARREQTAGQVAGQTPRSFTPQPAYPAYQPVYQPAEGLSSVRNYPPLVIINPSAFQNASQPTYPAARLDNVALLGGQREFRIVGEEAT
jgi:hypothetical protein